jgi:hypothetical protein
MVFPLRKNPSGPVAEESAGAPSIMGVFSHNPANDVGTSAFPGNPIGNWIIEALTTPGDWEVQPPAPSNIGIRNASEVDKKLFVSLAGNVSLDGDGAPVVLNLQFGTEGVPVFEPASVNTTSGADKPFSLHSFIEIKAGEYLQVFAWSASGLETYTVKLNLTLMELP